MQCATQRGDGSWYASSDRSQGSTPPPSPATLDPVTVDRAAWVHCFLSLTKGNQMAKTINGKTKSQSIRDIEEVVDDAYRSLEEKDVPYCATIADAIRAAAIDAIEKVYAAECLHDAGTGRRRGIA